MTNQAVIDLPGNALLQLRLQQAILAAQHSIKQVGLLVIEFDNLQEAADIADFKEQFLDKGWLRVRSALRDTDTIVRMDGGEVAVLLPSIGGPEDAALVAKKILKTLEDPLLVEDLKFQLRPRIGIALFPEHSTNANALLERADVALTAAKRSGTTFVVYAQDQSKDPHAPLRMSELRQAIVEDQLFLLYQPKVDLKTGAVSGVEVLTRWQHPHLGLISPDEFIPVAERTGLIIPLTLWVLHRSLLQCCEWNKTGMDVSMAVNLSMWNLEAQELPDQIEGLLKAVDLPPHKLELEITESAIMLDPQRAMRTLTSIKDYGVRFTIDDFGTGYSSLSYLKKLPVTTIKIDKSFVKNMETDKDDAVIVRSIIDLGHNLGLKVVAEGVENRAAKEMLTRFNCDEAQGYYFSRPIPAQKIPPLFSDLPRPGGRSEGLFYPDQRINGSNGKVVAPGLGSENTDEG